MKTWFVGALAAVLLVGLSPAVSEAKRLGGGKSTGMQRDMPARTTPDSTPAKPAQPAQPAQGAQAVPGGAAAAAAAPAKRSWMGPIAGLAAGLGIAALMSHLGLGEAFGNFLMMALLALAAVFVIGFLVRMFSAKKGAQPMQYAPVGAGAGSAGSPVQVSWPAAGGSSAAPAQTPVSNLDSSGESTVRPAQAFVPASFDSEGFERIAKMIFIRLQAANDAADVNDLRNFTTPEMFASVQLDLLDRGAKEQRTEVLNVSTQVLDVATEGSNQVVSVRFQGQLREEAGAPPVDFNEIWHLVKPSDDSRAWAIAGIEQMH